MPKPIVVMYMPEQLDFGSGLRVNTFELAAAFNGEKTQFHIDASLYKDYLWFCFPKDIQTFEIKVYHPRSFSKLQYSKLEALIKKEMAKLKELTQ